MIPHTNQDYHDKVTDLFDAYYTAEEDDKPTSRERVDASDGLIEHYVEQHGKRPPNAVLSRLATYILLDTLTDPHPDKMSREEYPIMSYGQTGRYFERNGRLKDEPYDHAEVIGYSPGLNDDGESVRDALLNPETAEHRATNWRLFIEGLLTEREALIVRRLYEDGATQAEVAEEIGVSERWIRSLHVKILNKLHEIFNGSGS